MACPPPCSAPSDSPTRPDPTVLTPTVATVTPELLCARNTRQKQRARRIDRGIWVPVNEQVLRLSGTPQTERRSLYRPPTTTLESAFLELVAGAGLQEPERQINLGGSLAWIGCVDFVWRRERVVVETDGGAYHDSLTDRQDDERRDRALEHAGWIVLRFSYLDVTVRPTSVRRTLSRALAIAAA